MKFVRAMLETHKLFHRRSQHFVLGNWLVYVDYIPTLFKFWKRYPSAWLLFMFSQCAVYIVDKAAFSPEPSKRILMLVWKNLNLRKKAVK